MGVQVLVVKAKWFSSCLHCLHLISCAIHSLVRWQLDSPFCELNPGVFFKLEVVFQAQDKGLALVEHRVQQSFKVFISFLHKYKKLILPVLPFIKGRLPYSACSCTCLS